MSDVRVGVINWDATFLRNTYFGHYCTQSLSPAKYHSRAPYFAQVDGEDAISFPPKTAAAYDVELTLAADAGIDYFAYVWYGEENQEALGYVPKDDRDCSGHCWELNGPRHLYTASPLNRRINMCAILASHPFTDYDLILLAREMREPYYEKICGRPLLYVFSGTKRGDDIRRVKRVCAETGTEEPYVCVLGSADGSDPDVNAVSAYATCGTKMSAYEELAAFQQAQNTKRAAMGGDVIPHFTMGWDPRPRIDHQCPWTFNLYPDVPYAPAPEQEQVLANARTLAEWIKATPQAQTGHILCYAWNEFEEGGWICPTLGGKENYDGFRAAAAYWHENL